MPIQLQEPFAALVPDGAIIGVVGLDGSGTAELLRAAAAAAPNAHVVDHTTDTLDALARAQAATVLEQERRRGAIVFFASHDEALLMRLADEVWWIHEGRLRAKGDPREALAKYRGYVAARLTEWGVGQSRAIDYSARHGDGAAEIVELDISGVLPSGESARIRVKVRFNADIEDPVIGIMIRTRVGFAVYGTNTELEGVNIGPQAAGATVTLQFVFRCDLCPGDYTLTAAIHDPDGTAHDWLDDAVAFTVVDSRYTAGVANLRAVCSLVHPD